MSRTCKTCISYDRGCCGYHWNKPVNGDDSCEQYRQQFKSMFEQFKEKLDSMTKEEILEEWKKVEHLSNVGPLATEYVEFLKKKYGDDY